MLEIQTGLFLVLGVRHSVFVALVVFTVWFFIILIPGATRWLDFAISDRFQNMAANLQEAHSGLVIAAIDSETLNNSKSRWPWPRSRIGELISELDRLKAAGIVLDVLLQGSQNDKEDSILKEQISRSGKVFLVYLIEKSQSSIGTEIQQFHSLDMFRDVSAGEGFVQLPIDSDGIIREVIFRNQSLGRDSCALSIAKRINPNLEFPKPDNDGFVKSIMAVPRKNGGLKCISVSDLFSGVVPKEFIQGKTVIIGATAPVLQDKHRTPFGVISGVEILSASIDMLMNQRIVTPMRSFWARLAAGLGGMLLGLLICVLVKNRPIWVSILAGLSVGVISLATLFPAGFFPPLGSFLICWFFGSSVGYSLIQMLSFFRTRIMVAEGKAIGDIQKLIFPANLDNLQGQFWCAGRCQPCEEAGGDFFDFFTIDDKTLVFMIGDVAGHGFGAAMVTSIVKTVATQMRLEKSLVSAAVLLEKINKVLIHIVKRKKMVTMLAGMVNLKSGQAEISFGGHLPAFCLRKNGTIEELGHPVFPIGASAKHLGPTKEFQLDPGDRLIIYSDGIVESLNWKNQLFEFSRWKEFCKTLPSGSFEVIWDYVIAEVNSHTLGRPFDDDVTLLIINRSDMSSSEI